MSALLVAAALAVDAALGEPQRGHPLVGFGRYASGLERKLHPGPLASPQQARWRGALALALAVLPFTLLSIALFHVVARWPLLAAALQVLLLYFTIGHRSLHEHARAVWRALRGDDLAAARTAVGRIVSRDCREMDDTQITAATVESVLENGSDAVFGALFWFAVFGAPGAITYRLINTLDAMWGYRTPRHRHFGFCAAKLDDAVNWLPARLTALSYALAAGSSDALRCWQQQAPDWDSPNGGPVMAAGAGALGLRLGGPARYHGQFKQRPALGVGRTPRAEDIRRALSLLLRALSIWIASLMLIDFITTRIGAGHA